MTSSLTDNQEHTCKICGVVKPRSEFYTTTDGYRHGRCKRCFNGTLEAGKNRRSVRERKHERERQRRASGDWNRARERKNAAASRVRHKEEARARYALNRAVKSGAITRPSHCEQCGQIEELNHRGQTNIHGHHDDYAKPLEVRWLCRKCHVAHHRALKDQKP